jgi:succinyl-CoA synthetase beta subunit
LSLEALTNIISFQINESGLKIFSIEDLQNAAEKSVQFSKVVKMAREIDVGVEFTLGI